MTEYNFEPRHNEVSRHVISGFLNSGVVQAIKFLCQFASVVVTSRLLPPTDFGIIAMAVPAYWFVTLFLDFGLGQATVQKPALTHEEANAFFWINTAAGFVLMLLLAALSPLAGWYFNEPRVVVLTAAMGPIILLSAIGSQPGSIMRRRMEFGWLALNDVIGTLSGLIAAVAIAVIYKSYWALYAGMAVSTVVSVAGIWLVSGWRPSYPRLVHGVKDLLTFGAAITLSNFMGYISGVADNLLIGRRWGDEGLGLYDRAYKLLLFPLQRVVGPIAGTMVPVLSRLTHEPDRYRSIFLRTLAQMALIAWPGILWALVMGDPLLPILLGPQWKEAIPIFRPLAVVSLLAVVGIPGGWILMTHRHTVKFTRWSIIGAITNVAAFVIGLPYGTMGVATAFAIAETLRTPFFWWDVTRDGPVRLKEVVNAILPQTIGCAAAYASLLAERQVLGDNIGLIAMGFGGGLAYVVTVIVMLLFPGGRDTLGQTLHTAHRILRHVQALFEKE